MDSFTGVLVRIVDDSFLRQLLRCSWRAGASGSGRTLCGVTMGVDVIAAWLSADVVTMAVL